MRKKVYLKLVCGALIRDRTLIYLVRERRSKFYINNTLIDLADPGLANSNILILHFKPNQVASIRDSKKLGKQTE